MGVLPRRRFIGAGRERLPAGQIHRRHVRAAGPARCLGVHRRHRRKRRLFARQNHRPPRHFGAAAR